MKQLMRIATVFLIATFLLSCTALASKQEYTWPTGWDVGTYSYVVEKGVQAEASKEEAHSGTYSLKVWNKAEKNTRIWTTVTGLKEGQTYTLTGFVKIIGALTPKNGVYLRVYTDYTLGASKSVASSSSISSTDKRWTEVTVSFTVPAGVTELAVTCDSAPIPEGAVVYWDDLEIKNTKIDFNGGFETITEIRPEVYVIPESSENAVINPSFEENDGTAAENWNAYKSWGGDNPYVSLTTEKAHTGKTSVKLTCDENGKNPWVSQMVSVNPGVDYLLTVWVYCDDLQEGKIRLKLEPYSEMRSAPETALDGAFVTESYYETDGEWMQIQQKFSTGIECYGMAIYPRFYGTGVCYYDDMEVLQLTEPKKMVLETDWGIYYPDYTDGFATAQTNPSLDIPDATVDFVLKDGDTVLKSQEKRPIGHEGTEFPYSVDLLAEKTKPYTIAATLYDAGGAVLETQETQIYVFDRSPYLREDGVYLKNKTTPFCPVFAYHSGSEAALQRLAEIGVNTVQLVFVDAEGLGESLELFKKYDIMALVALYSPGVKPAAHPDLIERNREAIETYKDHPNILGWMVQDEPFIHGEYNEVKRLLLESYAFIRSIDPEHPVYTLDNAAGTFYETSKYVDILATDPYPTSRANPATFITTQMGHMRDAVRGQKPIFSLVQAFELGIWPTGDQLRSSLYQSFFGGATAVGYYSVNDPRKASDGTNIPLFNTDLWDDACEFKNVDMDMAHKVFVTGEIPTFNDVRTENVWYRSWGKDGKLYLVALNRSNTETTEAEISLTSFDGSATVGAYTASIIAGGKGSASGDTTLKLTLQPCAAQLWEITPAAPMTFSGSSRFTYYDMNDYGWARSAAELMKEKDITYDEDVYAYRPAEKITRGDFAMFLVRTLGLSGDGGESFADVDANAHYAKEIAIGKNAGILKGVGDNRYNPEAEITRQDLMTIIARGMALSGEGADLSAYSDTAQIAEYALDSIKAMVQSGLVKGNADGTLNPLGNTTRAEAAVIMARILAK